MRALKVLSHLAPVLLTVCLMTVTAQASESSSRFNQSKRLHSSSITLIPTVGILASNVELERHPDETREYRSFNRTGLSGGMLVEFGHGLISFQTGIYTQQEGYVSTEITMDGTQRTVGDGRIDYVGLPLIGKLNLNANKRTKLYLKAGVTPAYVTAVREQRQYQTAVEEIHRYVTTETATSEERGGFRDANAIVTAGAGVSGRMTASTDLRFDVLYNRTLLPIMHDDVTASRGKIYTNSFSVNLGIGFSL